MPTTSSNGPAWALAAGAAVFGLSAFLHPHPDTSATGGDLDRTLAAMYDAGSWDVAHLVGFAGMATIAVAAFLLARAGRFDLGRRVRAAAWLVVAGAAAACVEIVPHLLAASESAELLAGEPTPLTDAHLALQAVYTPLLGLGVAALAVTGFRRVAHPVACGLGVVGGLALATVGPLLLATKDPDWAVLFAGANGLWLFVLAVGARLARPVRVAAPAPAV